MAAGASCRSNRCGNIGAKRQGVEDVNNTSVVDTVASHTTTLVRDCCLVEPDIGRSQGIGVESEDLRPSENYVACNECKDERGLFTQTADKVELERSSLLQDTLLNGNDADLGQISNRCVGSHTGVKYNYKIQSCLKQTRASFKHKFTYQTEHHISELRQLEQHSDFKRVMVWFPPGNENCKQRFSVSVDGVCTESPVKLAGLRKKGECYNTSATDIKVPRWL